MSIILCILRTISGSENRALGNYDRDITDVSVASCVHLLFVLIESRM